MFVLSAEPSCRTIAESLNSEADSAFMTWGGRSMLKLKKSRLSKPQGYPETFGSLEVSEITGVSLRQLQWWDERGVVSPVQRGHKRMYRFNEVIEIGLITELRKKGISLQKIRKVLRFLHKELGRGLFEAVQNGNEMHLLTDGRNIYLEDSHKSIVDILNSSRQPLISVCITDQVRRLTAGEVIKKVLRSEHKTAAGRKSRAS